jgi:hypothetical protein
MRIWLSGPRILGGLVRPGISFNLNELRRKATPCAVARGRTPEIAGRSDRGRDGPRRRK